jgi:serine/threonine-protein kinase
MRDPRIGITLAGKYVIEDALAEGGMSTVYLARHRLVDRPCAVKIMSTTLARNQVIRERFRREAKATQTLAHPNIIEIFDQGETDDGLPYIVMEFLNGEPLADVIARGPMALSFALPLMIQIARALSRAHDFEVIHRDLKPENIFLASKSDRPPQVKLLDFGIARSMHDARLTSAGEVFGTPQYMAPERITSIDAGPSADLYALGVIFFEMLSGRLPFHANDVASFFIMHMKEPAPSLKSVGIEVPDALDELILSLMAKTPEQRPVDAHRVHSDLVACCVALGLEVPSDLTTDDTASIRAPRTLPPIALDRWAERTSIFEQMLAKAYGETAPSEAKSLLERVRSMVHKVSQLRNESVKEQRRVADIEARGREGRQRFGFAMDALGIDASKARDEARQAHALVEQSVARNREHQTRLMELHAALLSWEGRCAFHQPYRQMAEAYRAAADEIDAWFDEKVEETKCNQYAEGCDGIVSDLDFQIRELRAGLARLEQAIEGERDESEKKVTQLGAQADEAEQTLLALATEFCNPLRNKPELAPLFRELERRAT